MAEAKADQKASTMRSLERAIDVLEVLEAARTPLRLSEVARRAGLHVATTQRILNVLEARRRVEQGPTGFRTGVAMLFGAHAYLASNPIAVAAPLVLQELASATGLTASVFVRAGDSRAVVARVEGKNPLRYLLPIGQRLPLHLGAGKALAAYMDPTELDETLDRVGVLSRASGDVVDRQALRAELDDIRRHGVAFSTDERVVGASSVAAPVMNASGECVAAIQVAGPTGTEIFSDMSGLGVEVRQAAAALAARLA
ncbi:IclR family transcriptional regulator [Nocardioides sediminis]|uniref:IclR family transcriptional regulator n=1 Tax=Nocardioides sediminis TaxID=433648 RepID=UPI000D30D8A9|nr:IclR family transcriptional regulator [Nocardioides sediminis]